MITFKRKDGNVEIQINFDTPDMGTRYYTATLQLNDDLKSSFVAKAFREKLWNMLKETRKEYYERGWKAAKAKTYKEDYFSGYLS